ncbi:hypothetical protein B0T18DRAFT_450958 [Schizothecium vesticola]|uniref:Uncharacterized protein n=1 Tax=Schizothecium vesticola TaxID=314040 RepID=A0AA40F7V5_9PEZI|nr:hypothetical protein B0T18DRAFT_450958 [Schizothecium vesticola]
MLGIRPQPSSLGPIRLADIIISHHFTIPGQRRKGPVGVCGLRDQNDVFEPRPSIHTVQSTSTHLHLTTPPLTPSTAQDSASPLGLKTTKATTSILTHHQNPRIHHDYPNHHTLLTPPQHPHRPHQPLPPPRPSQQGANPRAKYTRKTLPWSRSKLMKAGSPSDVDEHRRYLFVEQQRQQREQREREARGPRFYEDKDDAPLPPKKARKLVQPHILAYFEGMRTRQGHAYIPYRCECCYVIWTREAKATALRREEGRLFEEEMERARGAWDWDEQGGWEGPWWARGRDRVEMEDLSWEGRRGEETGNIVDGDEWFPIKMGEWVVLDDDVESVWSLVDSVVDTDSEYDYEHGIKGQSMNLNHG